jgi:rod shape-determining protein MreC
MSYDFITHNYYLLTTNLSPMLELFVFIGRYRKFILFVLLEVLSFWFIVDNNNYWGVEYFNTANALVAKSTGLSNAARDYVNLREVNVKLSEENRFLTQQLVQLQQKKPNQAPINYKADSVFFSRFKFVTIAKVIESTTSQADNYITIDKGLADGVRVGMGVVTPTGVVGKVKICNENYSIITSILHSQSMISTRLTQSGEIGPAQWESTNPSVLQLNDVSRYKKVLKGDTAVTSDYNAVFPPGILVGYVQKVAINKNQTDFDIQIKLATDLTKLSYVFLVDNKLLKNQESLQKNIEKNKK